MSTENQIGDEMWEARGRVLAELVVSAGVSLKDGNLVGNILQAAETSADVRQYLTNLPGYPSDPSRALNQLAVDALTLPRLLA